MRKTSNRVQRPMIIAGAPVSQRKLASASLPARITGPVPVAFELGQQKMAYSGIFETALKYGPAEAAEGLAMVLAVCLRTLQQKEQRTALVDNKTGEKMVLEVRLVRDGDEPEKPKSRRKRHP